MESPSSLTNRSRNTCRVILVAFGNFLKKRRYLAAERPTVFDGMSVWKDEIVPVTLYTPDEMQFLLGKAGEMLLPYLVIGAFAGLRNIEITRLDWSHIRLARGFIECEASMTKTRRRRLVPISENLRAWLQPVAQPTGPVAPYRDVATALPALPRAGDAGPSSGVVQRLPASRLSAMSNCSPQQTRPAELEKDVRAEDSQRIGPRT